MNIPITDEQKIVAHFMTFLNQNMSAKEIAFAHNNTNFLLKLVRFAGASFAGSIDYKPTFSLNVFVSVVAETFTADTAIHIIANAAFYKLAVDFFFEGFSFNSNMKK